MNIKKTENPSEACKIGPVQCMHIIHSSAHDVRNVSHVAIEYFYRMIGFQAQSHPIGMSVDRFNDFDPGGL